MPATTTKMPCFVVNVNTPPERRKPAPKTAKQVRKAVVAEKKKIGTSAIDSSGGWDG